MPLIPNPTSNNAPAVIYHIATNHDWQVAKERGEYWLAAPGGEFIHLCFADQLDRIASLRFSGRRDLVLLAVDENTLGHALRVEANERGGEQFPHLYRRLKVSEVLEAKAFSPVGG